MFNFLSLFKRNSDEQLADNEYDFNETPGVDGQREMENPAPVLFDNANGAEGVVKPKPRIDIASKQKTGAMTLAQVRDNLNNISLKQAEDGSNTIEAPENTRFVPNISLIPEQGLPEVASPDIPVGVTHFQTPDGRKTFDLGSVEHTGSVNDTVHQTVKEAITTRNPQIVITEGHPTYKGSDTSNPIIDRREDIIAWTKAEVERVQHNNGVQDRNRYIPEAGYAAYIAREHGIPSIGGEPAGQELFDLMKTRGYPPEAVVYDRFLREIEKISPEKRLTMTDDNFTELLATTNELVDPLRTANVPPLVLDDFKQWYALHPLSGNRRFIDVVHKDFEPHQDGSYSQVMTCHSGVVRDQHLVRLIADLQNQGYNNIMAFYGLHHLPSIRPVLEDKGMFGSPGTFTKLVEDTPPQQTA